MSAPEVVPVNSSTVRVLWFPPLQPNGAITGYYIYVNDRVHGSVDTSSGSYLLGDLLPFTIYNVQVLKQQQKADIHTQTQTHKHVHYIFICCAFQVEACTVYACARSNVTQTTTVEDLPADLATPQAQVISPR